MSNTWDLITWRTELTMELRLHSECWEDVLACTLSEEELDRPFDSGYGVVEGAPFTLWTGERVYFPCQYDGSEWVASVQRNPSYLPTSHVGG